MVIRDWNYAHTILILFFIEFFFGPSESQNLTELIDELLAVLKLYYFDEFMKIAILDSLFGGASGQNILDLELNVILCFQLARLLYIVFFDEFKFVDDSNYCCEVVGPNLI